MNWPVDCHFYFFFFSFCYCCFTCLIHIYFSLANPHHRANFLKPKIKKKMKKKKIHSNHLLQIPMKWSSIFCVFVRCSSSSFCFSLNFCLAVCCRRLCHFVSYCCKYRYFPSCKHHHHHTIQYNTIHQTAPNTIG